MKTNVNRICRILFFGALLSLLPVSKITAQPGVGSYQVFYDELSPYGQWIMDPQYGYVWLPYAGPSFRPYYSSGHWAYTPYGTTWVSDYPWGWAPFHYGRWTFNSFYGWTWIPGNVWGPAWVSWRGGGSFYGWAPMGPGFNTNISFGPQYNCPNDWWVFIPQQQIMNPGFQNYHYGPSYNTTIINNTTVINNTYINNNTYVSGPALSEIQQATGKKVPIMQIAESKNPGRTEVNNNQVSLYRPAVSAQQAKTNAAPASSIKAERPLGNPEPVAARTTETQKFNPEKATRQNSSAVQPSRSERNIAPSTNGKIAPQQQRKEVPATKQQGISPEQNRSIKERGLQPQNQRNVQPNRNMEPVTNKRNEALPPSRLQPAERSDQNVSPPRESAPRSQDRNRQQEAPVQPQNQQESPVQPQNQEMQPAQPSKNQMGTPPKEDAPARQMQPQPPPQRQPSLPPPAAPQKKTK